MTKIESALGKPVWEISKTLGIKEENPNDLKKNLELLKTNSLLIYFNHFTQLDPGIILKILNDYDLLEKTKVLVSRKHLDKSRGISNRFQSFIIHSASEYKKFGILPIVQSYDQDFYENYTSSNRDSLTKAVRHLREAGNILLIAPEGTRSKTNSLLKAEQGVEDLLKMSKNIALAYPIAIEYGKVVPFMTESKVIFGKSAYSYNEFEIEAKDKGITVTDAMMENLSLLLPFKNRGVYR
jgi:1-acyl-sn-glycerol-3-phosphate acyltransferase